MPPPGDRLAQRDVERAQLGLASDQGCASAQARPPLRRRGQGGVQVGGGQGLGVGAGVTSSAVPQLNRCAVTALVAGPTRTDPGRAADCSAAATLTTSPNAAYSTLAPPPIGPTTAGPDSTPIRSPRVSAAFAAVAPAAVLAAIVAETAR